MLSKRKIWALVLGVMVFLLFVSNCSREHYLVSPINDLLASSKSTVTTGITVADPDLIGYWNCNHADYKFVPDLSPNNLLAINLYTNQDIVPGVEGFAIKLNGNIQNLNVGPNHHCSLLNISGDITIEAWIKTSATWDEVICAKYNGTPMGYALKIQGGKLSFFSGGPAWDLSLKSINDGVWHHVAITGNGTTGTFYIDGQIDKTFTYTVPQSSGTEPFYIGSYQRQGCFSGSMDEIAIWKKALSSVEIKKHYQQYQVGDLNLIGYWKFDEIDGNLAMDSSVYANNGILKNNPVHTTGIYKNGLAFNGTSSYVDCGRNTYNIIGDISIEGWVKTSFIYDQEICAKYEEGCGYALKIQGGKLSFFSGGPAWNLSLKSINDGAWHYIAITGAGTTGKFYIDGQVDNTFKFTPVKDCGYESLYLGSYYGLGCFLGEMDEMAIWKKALTCAEILDHFNSPGH